jgi:hypothetical protein
MRAKQVKATRAAQETAYGEAREAGISTPALKLLVQQRNGVVILSPCDQRGLPWFPRLPYYGPMIASTTIPMLPRPGLPPPTAVALTAPRAGTGDQVTVEIPWDDFQKLPAVDYAEELDWARNHPPGEPPPPWHGPVRLTAPLVGTTEEVTVEIPIDDWLELDAVKLVLRYGYTVRVVKRKIRPPPVKPVKLKPWRGSGPCPPELSRPFTGPYYLASFPSRIQPTRKPAPAPAPQEEPPPGEEQQTDR